MSHPERVESQRVTIEDILRLKRSERPSPEFWGRFEEELRAKQLAAIVEKRPWWIALRLPQVARGLARFQVPMGAAAVLALSFVVVREYRPTAYSADIVVSAPASQPMAHSARAVSGARVVPPEISPAILANVAGNLPIVTATQTATAVVVDSPPGHASEDARVQSVDEPSVGPGGLMAMIPWASQPIPASKEPEPVVLGELSQVHFLSAINPGRDHDFQSRVEVEPVVMPVRSSVTVVAATAPRVVSPREVRRSQILSTLVTADTTSDLEHSRLAQVREVLAGALDDDRLYDSVRRLGMGGDRLTLKF